ncbi:MAG: hypothetical protein AAF439_03240 [Pseudomonadota bacterium]
MSFALPLALAGLLPVAALALLLWQRAPMLVSALPGGWGRIIEPALARYMARGLSRPGLGQAWLCLGIAALLVVAIARPLLPLGEAPDYANVAGRVIVLDANNVGMADRRIVTGRLLNMAPEVPTALVAVAGEAYSVVPFTTDRTQIDRYLAVLTPEMMPRPGNSLHLGIAQAEEALAQAGVIAAQIVLVTGAETPPSVVELPETETLRAVVVPVADLALWSGFADGYGARLIDFSDPSPAIEDIRGALSDLTGSLPAAAIDISPWLYGLAMMLWLVLFRRRSAS